MNWLARPKRGIQLGCHSGKGQNTNTVFQQICILNWSWEVLPIKSNEFPAKISGFSTGNYVHSFWQSNTAFKKSRESDPPIGSQLGNKLAHPAPNLLCEESFHVERLLVFQHEIDRPAQLMGENPQGFTFNGRPQSPQHTVSFAPKLK